MSSPPSASVYSTWRRKRAESITSQDSSLLSRGRDRALSASRAYQQSSLAQQQQPLQQIDKLSSSIASGGQREPIRSFINAATRDNIASASPMQYARSVREDTAELAAYQLTGKTGRRSPSFLNRNRSLSFHTTRSSDADVDDADSRPATASARGSEPIEETSEPEPSPPLDDEDDGLNDGPSLLTRALRRSPPETIATLDDDQQQKQGRSKIVGAGMDTLDGAESAVVFSDNEDSGDTEPRVPQVRVSSSWLVPQASATSAPGETDAPRVESATETTPLLGDARASTMGLARNGGGGGYDLEGQKNPVRKRLLGLFGFCRQSTNPAPGDPSSNPFRRVYHSAMGVKQWDRKTVWDNVFVAPVACLPAVIVGLLLNILDALSYGMILFPLGSPIFSHLGSAGISIFYVSTIVSQLTFSFGSIFTGGVGSELIEVVPFFHSMALTIMGIVGEDDPDAVIATTIVSYSLSAMVTGSVFYLMGRFKFGYIVGFIPRHILIGCIGGVGWFLIATGFEVTARIDGSLEYDLKTLHKLIQPDTIPLWTAPLGLAILLFWGQKHIASKYFLPLYILAIPFLFYFFAFATGPFYPDNLRNHGWVFEGPPSGEPWWFFYTLYKFDKVHWGAIIQCVPAMLALTFFGILHVPINVPALALNVGEDHADLNHELKLHGYSNLLSGCIGSIQNYLVYANTLFFMRSGGDTRLAGIELAILTFCVMLIGPKIIGFIPIMMVGCLIFDLGFELLVEAVWQPRKKLKLPEYVTVIAIVLIMGIYDFVVGIGVGILLAFVSLIFQTSQISAVRATYHGDMVNSTVRRNPSQQHYLRLVGQQIYILKLAGYLFFGTIVSVERTIRELIAEEAFNQNPIRYLILDLRQVTGLDYSAGEAFNTISRLLDGKGIHLIVSSVDTESPLGHGLRAVGLGEDGIEVAFLPDINTALELCENELLKTLYISQQAGEHGKTLAAPATATATPSRSAHRQQLSSNADASSIDLLATSPRRNHLQAAARESLNRIESSRQSKWRNFSEPLKLMLQIFHDLSDKNEDFWFRATRYFVRREYAAGALLFSTGATAEGFYLVEKGIIRAEYDVAHGQCYHESIVAGTTCGELPFFSDTNRTATAYADLDCVTWVLDQDSWGRLQKEEPEVASELLRVSLKLTAERMLTVPSSTMLMAD